MNQRLEFFLAQRPLKGALREFSKYYEYCRIPSYEERYPEALIHGVPFGKVNLVVLELRERVVVAGIEFTKSEFDLEKVYRWINNHDIHLGKREETKGLLKKAYEAKKGILFKGYPIILFSKGLDEVEYSSRNYMEITKEFCPIKEKIDTTKSQRL